MTHYLRQGRIDGRGPYPAWQRGGIENANDVLRRDVHPHATFSHDMEAGIDNLVGAFNTTPRKCFGFGTPLEAFAQDLAVALDL